MTSPEGQPPVFDEGKVMPAGAEEDGGAAADAHPEDGFPYTDEATRLYSGAGIEPAGGPHPGDIATFLLRNMFGGRGV